LRRGERRRGKVKGVDIEMSVRENSSRCVLGGPKKIKIKKPLRSLRFALCILLKASLKKL
jgi:hypothetical protein